MPKLVYEGKEIQITNGVDAVLGRHRDNAVPIADGKASRKHARVFTKDDGTVWVEDLESANGTEVNGEEIFSPRQLIDGDQIIIGKSKVDFRGDTAQTSPVEGTATFHASDPKDIIDKMLGGCRITSLIGTGHHGSVYRAKQLSLSREVAVKVFNSSFVRRDPSFAERFLNEARQAGKVQHHSVVKIHECGHDDGLLWYSMELVEGETLEDLLTRDGKVEPMLAFIIADQVISALEAAHEVGVIHGDVNPGTLMLSNEGKLKVLDLGIVRVLNSSRSKSGKKRIFGNPWYMSPERAKGEDGDERSDIYSLGCVLYHLLVGEPPFDDDSPKAILKAQLEQPIPNVLDKIPTLPAKVDEILKSMLSKNPSWRYASMAELREELKAVKELIASLPAENQRTASSPNNRNPAAQAAINLDRMQQRASRNQQSKIRRWLVIGIVFVVIVVAYNASGVSIRKLIEKHNPSNPSAESGGDTGQTAGTTVPQGTTGNPQRPTDPAAAALAQKWKTFQAQIDASIAKAQWGYVEIELDRFAKELAGNPLGADIAQSLTVKRAQVELDGDAWYRQQIAELPDDGLIGPRLARVSELRDICLSVNRPDADSRYQELITRLDQQMRGARRQARVAIERGEFERLPSLASAIGSSFTGTPVVGVFKQFEALTREGAAAKPLWQGNWLETKKKLAETTGQNALAAGAILMLAGYVDDGKRVLLNEAKLSSGDLVRRREALFGREAAILSFSDLGDLQYIETLQGDVRLEGAALHNVGLDACGLAISVPVGGESWSAGMSLKLGKGNGQVILSCVKAEAAAFSMRIESDKLVIAVTSTSGIENISEERPRGELKIRLVCRSGTLQVMVNNTIIANVKNARIPKGSQLRIESVDIDWTLDEVQVVAE